LAITVVGSVAFDSIEAPSGKREDLLGGSATYFSVAASKFTDVNLVAVVGDDFPDKQLSFLGKFCDLSGLSQKPGQTFRWSGRYLPDMNQRETLATHLNVFAEFKPEIPEDYTECETAFLANIDPDLQTDVLNALGPDKRMVGLDTMNFWIESKRKSLLKALKKIDVLTINEDELRQICDEHNIWKAGQKALELGPRVVVCKRGEYGSILFTGDQTAALPAFNTPNVIDPTGAGDSFAGAFFGYLDGKDSIYSFEMLMNALVIGTVVASFTVEAFGVEGLVAASQDEIAARRAKLAELSSFGFDFGF